MPCPRTPYPSHDATATEVVQVPPTLVVWNGQKKIRISASRASKQSKQTGSKHGTEAHQRTSEHASRATRKQTTKPPTIAKMAKIANHQASLQASTNPSKIAKDSKQPPKQAKQANHQTTKPPNHQTTKPPNPKHQTTNQR